MKEKLGIYIHIPFCKRKCDYCDFTSFCNKEKLVEKYIETLKKEMIIDSTKVKHRIIDTIYIGGGTPSYVDCKKIEELINCLNKNYEIDTKCEITIELNPGTITKEKLENYKKCGINRLSIGLQSINNTLLKEIGRIHTYEEFLKNYELAKDIGFKNINIDLMLGLPNQTEEILKQSIENVVYLNPEHISIYSLIVEKDTKLYKRIQNKEIVLPSEEIERNMYWNTKYILEKNDYIHYEISNFTKKGYESKHNMNCWEQKEYLGFGVSAHSYFNKTRYCNTQNIEKYINNIGVELDNNKTCRIVNEIQIKEDEQKEYMMLGLRKIQGVSISKFKNKFIQNPIYLYRKELDKLAKKNLIEIDVDNIKLTNKGIDFANLVWEEFV